MGYVIRPGQTLLIPLMTILGASACYGAVTVNEAKLRRGDGTELDLTPADAKMVEKGHAVDPAVTGTVQASGVNFSAGGGPAGEDIYNVTLDSVVGFAVNDLVRSQAAGKKAIYKVLAINGAVLSLHCAENEMLIEDAAVVEKVLGEGSYEISITVTYDNTNGLPCTLDTEIDVRSATTRGDAPSAAEDFDLENQKEISIGPASPRPITI